MNDARVTVCLPMGKRGGGVKRRGDGSGVGELLRALDERNKAHLLALVYDILPSTIAVFSYAIGSRKLSANEQFFLLVLKQ